MVKSTSVKSKNSKKIVALTLSFTTILSVAPINYILAKPMEEQSRYHSSQSPLTLISNNSKQNNQKLRINNYNRPNSNSNNPNSNWNNNSNNSNSNWNNNSNQLSNLGNLNVGTIITTTLPSANKILVTPEETLAVTLVVRDNVRDKSNQIIIPAGSQIVGEVRPSGQGSRFIANTVVLKNGNRYPINATSRVVTRTETVTVGKNDNAIWQGALAGAAAGTLLGAITGDKAIATEEVLGGAGFGALAGLLLRKDRTQELISINPEQDLNLTITSNFVLN
ncbi:hypothetical protein [Geminocystis sp. GBBB08]|uniref:hypothetical protein n=1 Tax=Geminocystis sp. GBBB08 TaxID=2604140 RepID=UPI0027E36ECA|nr:hypothetical protein [Geminocystis sp. GBBB08]MBL1210843.1 hypothetical protein [Geminocystis sp. GBBB08]